MIIGLEFENPSSTSTFVDLELELLVEFMLIEEDDESSHFPGGSKLFELLTFLRLGVWKEWKGGSSWRFKEPFWFVDDVDDRVGPGYGNTDEHNREVMLFSAVFPSFSSCVHSS